MIRITGMNSGLDTESIISELVSAKSVQKDNLVKAKTKLEWKQDAWKTLNSKIYSLYTSTLSNMRFSTAYAQKKTTVSNSAIASVVAGSDATDGVQSLKVDSLARSGYLTGAELTNAAGKKASYTSSTKLSDIEGLNLGSGDSASMTIKVGDKETQINLTGDSKISDVVKQLRDAGVNASFDEKNQRFFISALTTGADADFSLSADNSNGYNVMSALGINMMDDLTKKEYESLVNMTDDQKAAYIEQQTKLRSEKAQVAIDTANKMITENQEKLDKFFEEIDDPYYVKSELDTTDKITARKTELEAHRDVLKEVPENETEEAKTAREADLKKAEAQIKNMDTLLGYTKNIDKAAETVQENTELLDADSAKIREQVTAELDAKIATAQDALANNTSSAGATRIEGKDAKIILNNAVFTSASNVFDINGLTITAQQESSEEVTLTTSNDYDGIYDTIKKFLKGYNELVNEMDKLYNAESSKGYEPLTSDEKEAMSENEIEEWEKKIKDSLLRRDSTLGSLSDAMHSAMAKGVEIDGETYYLSNFGINTLGYFTAAENEKHAYHIDGDPDDTSTSGKTDKLKAMITNEPETVVKFFQELSNNLYSTLSDKMAASEMRSIYKVYNDKQMKKELDSYEKEVAEQAERIKAFEDKWYEKFSAMETALAKLNSKTSAISGLLG